MKLRLLSALGLAVMLGAGVPAKGAEFASSWVQAQLGGDVRWKPWSEQSLAEARAAGRSVYVFVGSELSELARTTLEQTFARRETADWLNENFTCLLVDADAQPEVAAYAQQFLNTVKQLRGWPAHLWLTPELRPYDGANYLPATEEWGRPGFLKSARTALDLWQQDPGRARALADEAVQMMKPLAPDAVSSHSRDAFLEHATEAWIAESDGVHGGFGAAPKQAEPELLRFLLARGGEARRLALRAADAVVAGGLHDRERGGFYRRTLDAAWQEPYRQKALLDQARVALALLEAAEAGAGMDAKNAALSALDFVVRDLRREDGSFAAIWDWSNPDALSPVLRGQARPAALGLLLAAVTKAQDSRYEVIAGVVAAQLRVIDTTGTAGGVPATALDAIGAAYGLAAVGESPVANAMLLSACTKYYDPALGIFMASGELPGSGLALRVPELAEPFRAEAWALLAGSTAVDRAALERTLLWTFEHDPLPAGEALLALSKVK